MNPEYFAQSVKLAALQAYDRHFYNDLQAKIVAAIALGKTEFTIRTDESIPREVLTALDDQGIHNAGSSIYGGALYHTMFDASEMLVNP